MAQAAVNFPQSLPPSSLKGGAFFLMGLITYVGLGISWTCLLAATVVGVFYIYTGLRDGKLDEENSFENIYSLGDGESKQKRMLTKKKEKFKKRRDFSSKMQNEDDDIITEGGNFCLQESSNYSLLEELEYSLVEDYNNVFAMSSIITERKTVPSLRSPQPLLSVFNCKFSKRESLLASPRMSFEKNHIQSPRSVFDDIQNRTINSSSWLIAEQGKHYNGTSPVTKVISPPGERYFSRIRKSFEDTSILKQPKFQDQAVDVTRQKGSLPSLATSTDTCSKEAVVKALQEKTASKRKRPLQDFVEASEEPLEMHNKKRRIEEDVLESTVDDFYKGDMKENIKQRFMKRSLLARPALKTKLDAKGGKTNAQNEVEKKIILPEIKKNIYGVHDSDFDLILENDNDDMDVDKKQTKRKANDSHELQAKGKKTRDDLNCKERSVKSIKKAKQKQVTPVRSVETQTPTKTAGNEKTENGKSPETPKQRKTSYKKVFTSGFPSNLKPETTEKRRRIPIYSGSIGDIEAIEAFQSNFCFEVEANLRFEDEHLVTNYANYRIAREEYGFRGVTNDAFKAEKKAEAERAKDLLDGKDDHDDNSIQATATTIQPITTTTTTVIQSSDAMKLPSISFGTSLTGFIKPQGSQETSAVQSFQPNSLNRAEIKSTDGSIAQKTLESTTSHSSNFQLTLSSDTAKVSQISTTTAGQIFPSSLAFDTLPQPNAPPAYSGLKFGTSSGPTLSVPDQKSVEPGTLTTVGVPLTAQPGSLIQSASSPKTANASIPVLGGLSFGIAATFKQDLPKLSSLVTADSNKPIALSSNTLSFGAGSSSLFSFGGNKPAEGGIQTSTQPSLQKSTLGGFNFGAPVVGASVAATTLVSSSTVAAFNLPASSTSNSKSSTGNPVSFLSTGFNFSPATSSTVNNGAFSFGSSVTSTKAEPAKVELNQPGSNSIFQAPSNQIGVTPSNQMAPAFGAPSSVTSVSTNLFSSPASAQSSSSVFGSQGAQVASQNQPASLFGTNQTPSAPFFSLSTTSAPGTVFGTPSLAPSNVPSAFGTPTQPATSSATLFGTQPQIAAGSLFGAPSQSTSTTGSLFGTPSQSATTAGTIFGTPSQSTSTVGSIFGTPKQATASAPSVFGTPSTGAVFGSTVQSSQPSNLLFGSKPESKSSSIFGVSTTSSGFSFGGQNAIFGATTTTAASSSKGGFSFGSNVQATTTTSTPSLFNQSLPNANFAQSNTASNQFGSGTIFNQPAPKTTTASGFSFGSTNQPAFGQSSAGGTQPAFGTSSSVGFGTSVNQNQPGGFNFTAVAQNPASFSFGSGAGASNGGFASRPGTPTPFGNAVAGGQGDLFSNPQQQQQQPGAGFSMGSGVANRPTVRGRRRARR